MLVQIRAAEHGGHAVTQSEIVAIVIALIGLFGSGGIWTYLDHRRAAREERQNERTCPGKSAAY